MSRGVSWCMCARVSWNDFFFEFGKKIEHRRLHSIQFPHKMFRTHGIAAKLCLCVCGLFPSIASFFHQMLSQFFELLRIFPHFGVQVVLVYVCLCVSVSVVVVVVVVWLCEYANMFACLSFFHLALSHLNSHFFFCLLFLYNLQIHYIIIIVLNT